MSAPTPARETPPLRISVTELVAGVWPQLFGLAGLGGRERMALGSALHAEHQARARRADPSYRAELALSAHLEIEGRAVRLGGRADGVRESTGGGLEVEELKTLDDAEEPSPALREAATRQVALYAWLLGEQERGPVRAWIVWLGTDPEAPETREAVPFDAAETEAWARAALRERVRAAEAHERELERRRGLAPRLGFPHARPRPGQAAIAAAVREALAEAAHLLVEAPTGLGKTAAVLQPALRFALAEGLRVVYLTARGTQQRGVLATHARCGGSELAPAVRLRSKRALCVNDALVCHEALCRFARSHRQHVTEANLVERVLDSGEATRPDALRELARREQVCPHALTLQAAERAALIVGDLNHLLEPGAALAPFAAGGDPGDVVLVVDEAHQLPERAREATSVWLEEDDVRRALDAAALGGAPAHRALSHALAALLGALRDEVETAGGAAADFFVEHAPDRERLDAVRAGLDAGWAACLRYGLATGGLDPDHPASLAWSVLRRFVSALEARDVETIAVAGRRAGAAALGALCPDPSPRLRARLAGCRAVVAMSATLSPLELHAEQLGLDPRRRALLSVPSPFPAERRRVVIDARVGTRLRERAGEAPRIARRLAALADAVPGHVLVLLPSFAFARAVAGPLATRVPRLLVQPPEASEADREMLLAALSAPAETRSVVLAVAGGILAEGVDLPGDALRAVAVVGPCLPPPDPMRELMRRHLEEHTGAGFELAYALPGIVRVVQAAGRVVRSEQDRGLVALYGRRFLEPPFRALLPAAWLDGQEPEALVGDPARSARAFFADDVGVRALSGL